MGFTEADWPLARIIIKEDRITITSLIESFEIESGQVVEFKTGLLTTRVHFMRNGERENVLLYGFGLKAALADWWGMKSGRR
jgi:hypothetical protein